MTGIIDLTAELPVWALAISAGMTFLLGHGLRRELDHRTHRCARCETERRHRRRLKLAARLGWPTFPGQRPTDALSYGPPAPLEPLEPEPETEDTDAWPLDSPIPVPPTKRSMPVSDGKLINTLTGPLSWAWDDTCPGAIPASGPRAVRLYGIPADLGADETLVMAEAGR